MAGNNNQRTFDDVFHIHEHDLKNKHETMELFVLWFLQYRNFRIIDNPVK
jgi:hypothetical protein